MGAMKEIANVLEELGVVAVVAYRSDDDGATVIDIETMEGLGEVRVNLNDGNIWAGDPEVDVPALLDGFAVAEYDNQPLVDCSRCGGAVARGRMSLRAYVAAAKLHRCVEVGR